MTDRRMLADAHQGGAITTAEYEAMRLWSEGWGYRRIAIALGISTTTVRDRIDRGTRKLNRGGA